MKSDYPMYWKLDGRTPVPCTFEETDWEVPNRKVAETTLSNGRWVSTVFLCMNHAFNDSGLPPIVFETMAFSEDPHGKGLDGWESLDTARCSTWEEAEAQHQRMVEKWS